MQRKESVIQKWQIPFFTLFVKIVCGRDLQKKVDGIKHLEDRLEELEPLEQSTKYMVNILKGNFVFK